MSDAEIQRLIQLPKRITEPPSKTWKNELAQRRKDFRLTSLEGKESFRAFARQSLVFQENFSIGLEFEPSDGSDSIILVRCNGPHGDFNRAQNPDHPHFHPHIHIATAAAISSGERPEKFAKKTDQFASIKEATRFFLGLVNVETGDQHLYFEDEMALTLFELPEGSDDAS